MYLRVTIDESDVEEHKLQGEDISVGRSLNNDICIPHESVSRLHLKIQLKRGKYFVTDLNTVNGTFIGDEQLIPEEEKEWPEYFTLRLGQIVSLELKDDPLPEKEDITEFEETGEKVQVKFKNELETRTKKKIDTKEKALRSETRKMRSRRASPSQLNARTMVAIGVVVLTLIQMITRPKKANVGIKPKEVLEEVLGEKLREEISRLDRVGPCAGDKLSSICSNIHFKTDMGEGVYLVDKKLYVVMNVDEKLMKGLLKETFSFSFGKERAIYILSHMFFKYRDEFESLEFNEVYLIHGKSIFYLDHLFLTNKNQIYSFNDRDLMQIFDDLKNKRPNLFNRIILPIYKIYIVK